MAEIVESRVLYSRILLRGIVNETRKISSKRLSNILLSLAINTHNIKPQAHGTDGLTFTHTIKISIIIFRSYHLWRATLKKLLKDWTERIMGIPERHLMN